VSTIFQKCLKLEGLQFLPLPLLDGLVDDDEKVAYWQNKTTPNSRLGTYLRPKRLQNHTCVPHGDGGASQLGTNSQG